VVSRSAVIFALMGIVIVFMQALLLRESPGEAGDSGREEFLDAGAVTMQMVMILSADMWWRQRRLCTARSRRWLGFRRRREARWRWWLFFRC